MPQAGFWALAYWNTPSAWGRWCGNREKGIQYSLRALPLGGMCRFYGEDDNLPVKQDAPLPFNAQKPWKRAVVVAAGPLMNVVLAVVLAAFALGIFGDVAAQVQEFSFADSPAEQAGMQVGDMLYAVDGKRLLSYAEAAPAIQAADPEAVTITVLRDGKAGLDHPGHL